MVTPQSNAVVYGTARTACQARRLKRSDVRPSISDSRLVWRESLELVDGRFVVCGRRWEGELLVSEAVLLDDLPINCSTMAWKTPPAFDADSGSYETWDPVLASGVVVEPRLLVPVQAVDSALVELGLPRTLGLNPLLEGSFGEKRLLVPALTLLHAIAAPSPAVFASLMHPLDARFFARKYPSGAVHVHGLGSLRFCDLSDRDLACLAYWLQDGRTSADDGLFAAIVGHELLRAPQAGGPFQFVIDGYENKDTIVVRRLGQHVGHQCWPADWVEVCLFDNCGRVRNRLVPLPGRLLSSSRRPVPW